jgi:uncharacterized protein YndB with AHSA1/START domain
MRFTNTVRIDRSPEEVFAYLAQFENIPRWNYAIAETQQLGSGPVGVGSRYRQVRTLPRRAEEFFEIVAFEPARSLTIRGDIGPFFGDIDYTLEDSDGATLLTNTCELRGRGALGVLTPLATGQVRSAVAANLDVLRRLLES